MKIDLGFARSTPPLRLYVSMSPVVCATAPLPTVRSVHFTGIKEASAVAGAQGERKGGHA
jgi:hypothetical protein